jgi:hypothetical protein
MWFHHSRLTSGGQYATTSAAFRARQAAHALLATAQHLYLGSRQAETARGTWDHSSMPGLEGEPPVWVSTHAGSQRAVGAVPGNPRNWLQCSVLPCKRVYGFWRP